MTRATALLLAALCSAEALLAAPPIVAEGVRDSSQDVALRAAFVYNFVKFTEWPALPPNSPILLCIVGDEKLAAAILETVAGQSVSGHALEVSRPATMSAWRACHVLFLAQAETRQASAGLAAIKTLPVLTVSDGKGFAQSGGMIELYVENGRRRFAINVAAAELAGLRLSSRLLGLARIVRTPDVH